MRTYHLKPEVQRDLQKLHRTVTNLARTLDKILHARQQGEAHLSREYEQMVREALKDIDIEDTAPPDYLTVAERLDEIAVGKVWHQDALERAMTYSFLSADEISTLMLFAAGALQTNPMRNWGVALQDIAYHIRVQDEKERRRRA